MSCCNKSITNTVIHGAIGLTKAALNIGIASDTIIKDRRDKCRICPHASKNNNPKFDKFGGLTSLSKCDLCKCFISPKSRLLSEACPLGFWNFDNPVNIK